MVKLLHNFVQLGTLEWGTDSIHWLVLMVGAELNDTATPRTTRSSLEFARWVRIGLVLAAMNVGEKRRQYCCATSTPTPT